MKITLQSAVTMDGFIARADGSTEWMQDYIEWEQLVRKYGNMIVGRNTYEEIQHDLFPGVSTFVMSSQGGADRYEVMFMRDIDELLREATDRRMEELLLIGGGRTNGSFIAAGMVDEMILDIHPLLLGDGIPLLGDFLGELNLELLESRPHKKFTTNRYRVLYS